MFGKELLTATILVLLAVPVAAQPPQAEDAGFARSLWSALKDARMVGEGAIRTRPYEGTEPHGAILEFLADEVTVDGRSAQALVKRNYGGEGITVRSVWATGGRDDLAATTVMYKREAGYDPPNGDWFWVKYSPTGELEAAGRAEGCITCHAQAPGGDMIYSYGD